MPNSPLTDIAIRNASVGTHWDSVIRGFGLRVGKNNRSFIVLLGSGRRFKIGQYPAMSLSDARKEARRHLAEKHLGKTIPKFVAFEDARNRYLEAARAKNRPSTVFGYQSRLNRIPWGRTAIAEITPRDVLATLATFKAPIERRYIFIVLRAFFNFCIQQHYLDVSPMARLIPPPNNESRDRFLSPAELQAVWHACPDDAFGRSVKLLILTGQRRGEIEHIDLEGTTATIPGKSTKNKRTHTFPVPTMAVPLLEQPLGWNGWGKCKERLDKTAQVTGWTLHDLRRTYATIHAQLGTPPHVIEALLNHKTGIVSGIAQVYNRYRYLDEMRAAVAVFEKYLTATVLAPAEPPT